MTRPLSDVELRRICRFRRGVYLPAESDNPVFTVPVLTLVPGMPIMPSLFSAVSLAPQYIALPGTEDLLPEEEETTKQRRREPAVDALRIPPQELLAQQRIGPLGQVLLRLSAWKNATELDSHLAELENQLREEGEPANRYAGQSPEKTSAGVAREKYTNRRKLPRHAGKCKARIYRCRKQVPLGGPDREWLLSNTRLQGSVYDISLQAVAIDLPVEIGIGETLLLRLENRFADFSFDTVGAVVRSVLRSDGGYRIACELKPRLTLEDICQLGWASPVAPFL